MTLIAEKLDMSLEDIIKADKKASKGATKGGAGPQRRARTGAVERANNAPYQGKTKGKGKGKSLKQTHSNTITDISLRMKGKGAKKGQSGKGGKGRAKGGNENANGWSTRNNQSWSNSQNWSSNKSKSWNNSQNWNSQGTKDWKNQGKAASQHFICVENVPRGLTWKDLKSAFSAMGEVLHCDVDNKRRTASLSYATYNMAQRAVETYNGGELNDEKIRVYHR